jgi:diacylglycerol kinase (ATP)
MRRAMLLYNPLSGRRQHRRLEDVSEAMEVLRRGGVELTVVPTASARRSAEQAREAASQGYDAVLACGGDGTVHDILQGLVGTSAVLGVIPLGTANALAHDLKIPLSPTAAARALLTANQRRIAVGRMQYTTFDGHVQASYFIAAAGIGVDAHLFHALNPGFKLRFGMLAYCVNAFRLWLTLPFTNFAAEFTSADGVVHSAEVSELLAVRIRNFGGVLRELAPGASLDRPDLRLVLFKTQSRWRYLQYVLRRMFGSQRSVPGIDWAHSAAIECHPLPGQPAIYVEADGEILGALPARIEMTGDAITVLAPNPSAAAV